VPAPSLGHIVAEKAKIAGILMVTFPFQMVHVVKRKNQMTS